MNTRTLEELNQLIQQNPRPEYFLQRAMLYDEMKLYEDVRKNLEEGINLVGVAPHNYDPELIGDLYYKNGINYKMMQNYEFAIQYLNAALTIDKIIISDKMRAQCLGNIGICYQMIENFQTAYKYFVEAQKFDPSHGWYDFLIGTTMPNEYDRALSCFTDAIIKQYSSANLYYHIAFIYFKNKNIEQALKNFQTTIHIEPQHENALLMLGNIYYEEGNFEKASEYYDKILIINPYNQDALLMIRRSNKKQELDKAYNDSKKILENDPLNQNALFKIGNIYYEENNFEKAYEYFNRVLEINSSNEDALLMMGHIYYEVDNFQKAGEYYNRVLKINSYSEDALLMMGHIYLAKENFEAAYTLYNRILIKHPSNQNAQEYLGKCLIKLIPESSFPNSPLTTAWCTTFSPHAPNPYTDSIANSDNAQQKFKNIYKRAAP